MNPQQDPGRASVRRWVGSVSTICVGWAVAVSGIAVATLPTVKTQLLLAVPLSSVGVLIVILTAQRWFPPARPTSSARRGGAQVTNPDDGKKPNAAISCASRHIDGAGDDRSPDFT
jgi:hypothetical protein